MSLNNIKELSIQDLIKYERQTNVDDIPPDILRVIVSKLTQQNAPTINQSVEQVSVAQTPTLD